MKGVILDADTLGQDVCLDDLYGVVPRWDIHGSTAAAELPERLAGADLVLSNKVVLDGEAIRGATGLQYIGVLATGTNNIDVDAARQQGIPVCNAVRYCTASVVQHTLSLMLALCTRLPFYDRDVRAGLWQQSPFFCRLDHPVAELGQKTLVIAGYGELGRGVARACAGLGMEVLIAGRPGQTPADLTPDRLPWEEALARADVLSLHCPLTPGTDKMINARALEQMKADALLINTARGGLVDEPALAAALRAGCLGGAALDVLSAEPPPDDHPLLDPSIPGLIITPHIAWASRRGRQTLVDETVANIRAWQEGRPRNLV